MMSRALASRAKTTLFARRQKNHQRLSAQSAGRGDLASRAKTTLFARRQKNHQRLSAQSAAGDFEPN
jgi:hypothetical protein